MLLGFENQYKAHASLKSLLSILILTCYGFGFQKLIWSTCKFKSLH